MPASGSPTIRETASRLAAALQSWKRPAGKRRPNTRLAKPESALAYSAACRIAVSSSVVSGSGLAFMLLAWAAFSTSEGIASAVTP